MKHFFTTIVFLALFTSTHAQTGFLGKRFTLLGGTSFSPPVLNYAYNGGQIGVFYEWSLLPTEVEIELGYVVTERINLGFTSSFKGLQNSGFIVREMVSESSGSSDTYIDSFIMRSNTVSFGIDMKLFSEYAPVGKYFLLGGGFSRTSSEVYPTYVRINQDNSINAISTTTTKSESGSYSLNCAYMSIGFGKSRLVKRNLMIDYGVKSSVYLGKYNYGYTSAPGEFVYQDNFKEILQYIMTGNLHSSGALEFYFKIGIGV